MDKQLEDRERKQIDYCKTHCHAFRRGFYKHGDMTVPSNFGCVNSQDLTVLPKDARDRYGFGSDVEIACFSVSESKVCPIFSDLKKLDRA